MKGRRGKGFNRIESEDGLRAFNLKVFGTRARTQEVSLSELPALTGYAIRACSLSDRGVFSGVFVYAVETAIQTLQSSTPELAPHLETPDPVVDMGMRQPECGDDSDRTQLSIRNVLRLSFRGEFEWVGEIIGYYMIRHVLMHTGGPSQDSAMEPIRYWLYSYTETDVAMVAAAVLGLATSDTLHGRYPQRESVILDEHKIRIASLAKIISTSLMNGTRHYKQVYDDRVCKKLPGIITKPEFSAQFARLVALIMTLQSFNGNTFNKNVPAGEPQRLQREMDILVRWFGTQQPSGRHRVASWLMI